ncbi:MAG: winged helix-turn-helix transcriptional regulator [Candidatus Wildermuthbacteria bacterium]|nr:winged helix-turn-helix transcriptional regulator [Candidatus Wildermuthbacteria bacterium]
MIPKERIPFVFEALGDQTRLKIFQLLAQKKDLCVTDIAKIFKISVPATSYQLKIMEVVGLVEKERMGKMICYGLRKKDPLIKSIMRIIL